MIISRISGGLANQMMEYASAYSLSREMGTELAFDVSGCVKSSRGFLLDYFNIPIYRKIVYPIKDSRHCSLGDLEAIPECIRIQFEVFTDNDYISIEQAQDFERDVNIYLTGYFSDRRRYYDKFWDELRKQFVLRNSSKEVKWLKDRTEGVESVSIHIRRGDMLLQSWAEKMEDEYYFAAVEWFREHFSNCKFFVFSDDIEYAKKLFEDNDTIDYVHFVGYGSIDVEEFYCMTLCKHHICSNSSTYSRLSSELSHWGGITLWQGKENKNYVRNDPSENGESNVVLTRDEIDELSQRYIIRSKKRAQLFHKKRTKSEKTLIYEKYKDLIVNEVYDYALQNAVLLYREFKNNREFMDSYTNALIVKGYVSEAVVEDARLKSTQSWKESVYEELYSKLITNHQLHFLIVPIGKSNASGTILGLMELAMVLYHLGHQVTAVLDPQSDIEDYYVANYKKYTNRHRTDLSTEIYQYRRKDIEKQGIPEFIEDLSKQTEEKLIVLAREPNWINNNNRVCDNVCLGYIDGSDKIDAESRQVEELSVESRLNMESECDFIVTKNPWNYTIDKKVISYDVCRPYSNNEIEWIYERYEFCRQHRLDERNIYIASSIISFLKDEGIIE